MAHQQRASGETEGSDAVQRHRAKDDTRLAAPGQDEAASPNPRRIEDLYALAAIRRVGNGEAAVNRHIERAGLDQSPFFGANLHELPRDVAGFVNGVNRMPAPIEDVIVAVGGLLESDRFPEQANDMRGQ